MSQLEKLLSLLTTPSQPERHPTVLPGLGENRIDNYYWLRDINNPKTIEYIEAENNYSHSLMDSVESLRAELYSEFLNRIELADTSVPQKKRKYWHYSKTNLDSQYEIHLRYINPEIEEVILDENQLAEGKEYFSIGSSAISDDEETLAYGVDEDGSEIFTIYIKDLKSNTTKALPISKATYGLEFDQSASRLFWVEADEAMRPFRVNCFDLADPANGSTVVFTEHDEGFGVSISKSKDDKTLLVETSSTTSSEVHLLDLESDSELETFLSRQATLEYSIEPVGNLVYILSNHEAENFKISICPRFSHDLGSWIELRPHDPNIKVESIEIFTHHIAIEERKGGFLRICIVDLRDNSEFFIPVREEGSTLEIDSNPLLESPVLRYAYTSLLTPRSIREIHLESKEVVVLKDAIVRGGFTQEKYRSEVIWIEARDGTKVPVSILALADTKHDGTNPVLLYGYGSYEHSVDPAFSSIRLSLCDRGIIFAIAHVRGGGELGRKWYLDGKLDRKHNTFNDFVDAARALIGLGLTSAGKIITWGGSAGGMLVTAALNQDPDLFGGVVAEVPFVDCLTTISDPTLPLTIPEWQEWGNPLDDWAIFHEMLSYSPYDNLRAGLRYPPIFATAGINDPRVSYFEPAKWVARIRETTVEPQVLLWVETGAGHFGASGRFNEWEMVSRIYTFILLCAFDDIPLDNN